MKLILTTIIVNFSLGILYGQNQHDTLKINDDLFLVSLTDNSWIHVSYLNGFECNGLILVNNQKAFLFDTPSYDSITVELTSYIQDKMRLEIAGFVTNDWHIDSQGGL
ncbi:MAG: hypothetical protein C0597_09285 [Marinilabiliales bacterium]|nr:MAG: hypothetical protein C0597_09285 [Marinilabiliales bacterium]